MNVGSFSNIFVMSEGNYNQQYIHVKGTAKHKSLNSELHLRFLLFSNFKHSVNYIIILHASVLCIHIALIYQV